MTRKYLAGWSWSLPCWVICGMLCSIPVHSGGWTEALNEQRLVWVQIGQGCAKHCWVRCYGRGGPLEHIYGTRESLHAVMGGEHSVVLNSIMQFLEVPDQLKQFPRRPFPSRPDTSKQVMSLPFKFKLGVVQIVRTSDKLNRTKTVASQALESYDSSLVHVLAFQPLLAASYSSSERGLGGHSSSWC